MTPDDLAFLIARVSKQRRDEPITFGHLDEYTRHITRYGPLDTLLTFDGRGGGSTQHLLRVALQSLHRAELAASGAIITIGLALVHVWVRTGEWRAAHGTRVADEAPSDAVVEPVVDAERVITADETARIERWQALVVKGKESVIALRQSRAVHPRAVSMRFVSMHR